MSREREEILLIGTGDLGGLVLEILCRIPGICKIITADSHIDLCIKKTNSAIEGASYLGLYPTIEAHHCNLLDSEKTAEFLARFNPKIIFNGTTLLSPLVLNKLPPEALSKLYERERIYGPWTAMHVALPYKLMKAVKMSGITTYVINSSYPDAINPSLARVGLAPTVGIGNIDLIVPYIRKTVSEILNVPMRNIEVELIAHHYHAYSWCRYGTGYEVPHYLKVYYENKDVTRKLGDMKRLVSQLPKHGMRPSGYHSHFISASSSVKNILAILNDTDELTHAPGPQGLEGGYPIRLGRNGAEVILPKGMTIEQARKINLDAQRYDGIEEIRDNGDIVITEEAYCKFKEALNMGSNVVDLQSSFEQAMELKAKFNEFAKKYGVST